VRPTSESAGRTVPLDLSAPAEASTPVQGDPSDSRHDGAKQDAGALGEAAPGASESDTSRRPAPEWRLVEQPGLDDVLDEVELNLDFVKSFEPTPGRAEPTRNPGELTPGAAEAMSGAEGATPHPDAATPDPDEATPGLDEATPDLEGGTPDQDEATPGPEEGAPGPDDASPNDWMSERDEVTLTGGWDVWDPRTPSQSEVLDLPDVETDSPASVGPVDPDAASSPPPLDDARERRKRGAVPPGWEREFEDVALLDDGGGLEETKPVAPVPGAVGPELEHLKPVAAREDESDAPGEPTPADAGASVGSTAHETRIGPEDLPLRPSRTPAPTPRREADSSSFPLIRVLLLLVLLFLLLAIGMGWLEVPGLGAETVTSFSAVVAPKSSRLTSIR
jgi:hypothetical protein